MLYITFDFIVVRKLFLREYKINFSFNCLSNKFCSLLDEAEECRKEAIDVWSKIGLMYLKDNEDKLKEKIEYLPEEVCFSEYDGWF